MSVASPNTLSSGSVPAALSPVTFTTVTGPINEGNGLSPAWISGLFDLGEVPAGLIGPAGLPAPGAPGDSAVILAQVLGTLESMVDLLRNDRLRAAMSEVRRLLDQMFATLADQEALQVLRSSLMDEQASKKRARADLEAALVAARNQLAALDNTITTQRALRDKLVADLAAIDPKKEPARHQQVAAELAAAEAALAASLAARTSLVEDIARKQGEVGVLTAAIAELDTRIASATAELAGMASLMLWIGQQIALQKSLLLNSGMNADLAADNAFSRLFETIFETLGEIDRLLQPGAPEGPEPEEPEGPEQPEQPGSALKPEGEQPKPESNPPPAASGLPGSRQEPPAERPPGATPVERPPAATPPTGDPVSRPVTDPARAALVAAVLSAIGLVSAVIDAVKVLKDVANDPLPPRQGQDGENELTHGRMRIGV